MNKHHELTLDCESKSNDQGSKEVLNKIQFTLNMNKKSHARKFSRLCAEMRLYQTRLTDDEFARFVLHPRQCKEIMESVNDSGGSMSQYTMFREVLLLCKRQLERQSGRFQDFDLYQAQEVCKLLEVDFMKEIRAVKERLIIEQYKRKGIDIQESIIEIRSFATRMIESGVSMLHIRELQSISPLGFIMEITEDEEWHKSIGRVESKYKYINKKIWYCNSVHQVGKFLKLYIPGSIFFEKILREDLI